MDSVIVHVRLRIDGFKHKQVKQTWQIYKFGVGQQAFILAFC